MCFPSINTSMTERKPIPIDESLYKHVLAIQAKAYALYDYPCIRTFDFVRSGISTLTAYQQAIALGREREGGILLDLGCCFGTDMRQAASDGLALQNLIAIDIHPI
ncbi:hypothetical protein FB451DRAFT_1274613 [Mycena latifolia]|nr:hypothetical protein FB451DRAFT_1274613 [Mycena latifolia]